MAQRAWSHLKAFPVIHPIVDLQVSSLKLNKEISWEKVVNCTDLYVEMMRHRVTINAVATYNPVSTYSYSEIMWVSFVNETRKFLDSNNVGLYSFRTEEQFFNDSQKIHFGTSSDNRLANRSEGTLTIYFEDSMDYAKYLKERAVMFKLSSINTL